MSVQIFESISAIEPKIWNDLNSHASPFLNYQFLHALEMSHCIGEGTGWKPLYFAALDQQTKGILYCFEKDDSYGEFIFDWGWVDAYHRTGIPYYPKLSSMIPFTPTTTPHFIMKKFNEEIAHQLLDKFEEFYREGETNSAHFLFLTSSERKLFQSRDYLIRESLQYHFYNENYVDFDDLLKTFRSRKSKQIRKERKFPKELTIESFTGEELTPQHAIQMYQFHNSTILNKGAPPFLSQRFFTQTFESMKNNVLYVQASEHAGPVAGALYFYDSDRLFGRYWGTSVNHPNLHFELCYYQGIDFCLKKKISVFEGGAQGEYKISRGFKPVKTYSAHLLKNKDFHQAIDHFISEEKSWVDQAMVQLADKLPYISRQK